MTERFERAFGAHDAFEATGDGFAVTTTEFDGRVAATETADGTLRYTVTVRAPTLDAAVEDEVGPAVREGWLETFERRLEDAAGAVRQRVDIDDYAVREAGDEVVAVFEFEWADADGAPALAKAIVEFTEGTYMEGIVPGYDYREPVASMLSQASQGDGERGGTPL